VAEIIRRFEWRFLGPAFWALWLTLGLAWLISFMPRRPYQWLSGSIGVLAMRLNHKRRELALTNIRLCFPDKSEAEQQALMEANFRITGQCLMDLGTIWLRGPKRLAKVSTINGVEHYHAAREAGKQVILMTCHSPALDHGAMALAINHPDVHAVSMYKAQRNPLLAWMMYRSRRRYGTVIYERKEGLRPIIRDVKKGAVFYYLPDEDFGPEESIFVPLFGVQKATIPALGPLARMTRAAVLPCISGFDEASGKYVVNILPPLADFPSGDQDADTLQMNQALEALIRIDPPQYMWIFKLFKTRPEGEKPFY
jgi:lauroyl-KDO2-lipid IV(A) myristoyltransferase